MSLPVLATRGQKDGIQAWRDAEGIRHLKSIQRHGNGSLDHIAYNSFGKFFKFWTYVIKNRKSSVMSILAAYLLFRPATCFGKPNKRQSL